MSPVSAGCRLPDRTLAGIAASFAIVNIPKESSPLVFGEMGRVLKDDGLLVLSFHTGGEKIRVPEQWGVPISRACSCSRRRKFEGYSRRQRSPSNRSSSESLTPLKSSTRAGEHTSLRGSGGF
jgi:hypothetical protein